ncbi:Serine/threonine-protein kinase RsbT [Luteitalea pratensis]|uniref:Serine/threonine-protein kinase RsbT n=2 Tax=Luteitalea pratensis TaxID=1855912 RepID=A0A143PT46_LUTPR|nr:Serine/threonine-protein kinase RsbT [Luteitalea pratensis]
MTDVQRCLQDGFSTVGTPGNGLGAVKRLSDEFDVHSTPGKGTVIVSRIATSTAPSTVFTVGAVCLPFPRDFVRGRDDATILVVSRSRKGDVHV